MSIPGFTIEELAQRAQENLAVAYDHITTEDFETAAISLNAAQALVDMAVRIKRDGIRFTGIEIKWGDGSSPAEVTVPKREEV